MRKKIILFTLIVLASFSIAQAQSYGYVNTEKILEKIPEYTIAQQQIEGLKKQYEAQVSSEMKIVESFFNRYQSEKSILSQNERVSRENEIITKERSAKELQKTYFGQDGMLSNKSKELLTPIKDRVQTAIDQIAKENNLILVFDIATAQGIIYNNPSNDLSAKVLQRLNIR
jgi:outer membrane protein